LSLIGFSEVELDALLPGAETLSEDDAPVEFDETVPAVSQLGDVWRLGKHRLICADNGDQNAISALFGDARAYLLFTSPPYANQRDYKNPITDWTAMMDRMIVAAEQSALTDDTQILVNLGMIFRENEWEPYWREWEASMRCEGFRRFALYIWDKMMAVPGDYKGRLAQRHEFIFHFNKRSRQANKIVPCKYAGLKKEFNYCFRGKDGVLKPSGESTTGEYRIPDSVIQVLPQLGQIGDGIDHPAVFSVDLPRFVMETYTDKGEIVYEPFCGSGTSIIAGERCGRIVYAAEIAPEYVDVALKRWTQNYPGEPPTLEKTGQTFEEVEEERLSNLKS
jgi:DNA modification methylase